MSSLTLTRTAIVLLMTALDAIVYSTADVHDRNRLRSTSVVADVHHPAGHAHVVSGPITGLNCFMRDSSATVRKYMCIGVLQYNGCILWGNAREDVHLMELSMRSSDWQCIVQCLCQPLLQCSTAHTVVSWLSHRV